MSESMAFIGGVAVAGLAALLLLKGTGSALQPNYLTPQMPSVVAPQSVVQPGLYSPYGQAPYPNAPVPNAPSTEERVAVERVKMENENLKKENDQLKTQIQQIQFQIQNYNNQLQMNAQHNQVLTQAQPPDAQTPWWSSPIVWAVGGMTLTIGGGVVVAGVLALFSPKQRPTRTVQVIHPYNNGTTPPLSPVRRTEFLPSRRSEPKRVEAPEYDDIY